MNEVLETDKISKELNKIYRHLLRNDRKIAQMQKDLQEWRNQANKQFKELNFADLLHDTIINSTWLNDKSFSLYGWAANYSFIYMLYRILDSVKPMHILEMGMGQTSRVTSQYIANCNLNASLDIIENDAGWISTYKPQLAQSKRTIVHQCDLEFFTYNETECRKYKDLAKVIGNTKYDLIVIDGPWGGCQTLPRSNILDIINGNLSDDFVIVFDDAERKGEQETIEATKSLLTKQGTAFYTFIREGIKRQCYITSISKQFIEYL